MSLRKRVSLIAGASVGVAVALAVLGCYLLVRSQLRGQVDSALAAQQQADIRSGRIQQDYLPGIPASAGGPAQYQQIVLGSGQVFPRLQGNLTLPVTARVRRIAAAGSGSFVADVHVGDNHLRLLCFGATLSSSPGGPSVPGAVELARPLNGTDTILAHLRVVLALLLIGGIVLAVALGRLASRRVLAPLAEVAQAVQHIGETDDLSSRLRVHDADDEVGQLVTRFNHMLDRLETSRAALDESVRAQRQLVADASHELRTPVTSLRTNIEVLLEGGELDAEDRRRLLSDVVEQSEELTALVSDLIELARGDEHTAAIEEVRVDRVAEESVARARRNAPQLQFEANLTPTVVDGRAERLGRAINNLLDNASRHSPPGATVALTANAGGVTVRDHGPGVAREDQPYVFDRFFRGASARGSQGSGLGLAIVRQVAEQHGGGVAVADAPGGGALFTLRLPGQPAGSEHPQPDPDPAPVDARVM
ncbi:MAG: sensor histidine kinase [Solirubrobacteraceae bacterium]